MHYHVGETSRRKPRRGEAYLLADFDWVYTVVTSTPNLVQISAQGEGEARPWQLTLTPDGKLHTLHDGIQGFSPDVPDGPYLPPSYQHTKEGVAVWPDFPIEEPFGSDDADRRQRMRRVDGGLEVVIFRAGDMRDIIGTRTATMRWEEGRPWWSTMRIDVDYVGKDVPGYVQLEGKVTAWPKSTP